MRSPRPVLSQRSQQFGSRIMLPIRAPSRRNEGVSPCCCVLFGLVIYIQPAKCVYQQRERGGRPDLLTVRQSRLEPWRPRARPCLALEMTHEPHSTSVVVSSNILKRRRDRLSRLSISRLQVSSNAMFTAEKRQGNTLIYLLFSIDHNTGFGYWTYDGT